MFQSCAKFKSLALLLASVVVKLDTRRPTMLLLIFSADVRDVVRAQDVVTATFVHFAHLDIEVNRL